jgi:Na+/H+ antiporter NhaC
MGYKSRPGGWNIPICLKDCQCRKCRKKKEEKMNLIKKILCYILVIPLTLLGLLLAGLAMLGWILLVIVFSIAIALFNDRKIDE